VSDPASSSNGDSSSAATPEQAGQDAQPAGGVVVPVGGLTSSQPALNGSMAELRARRTELAQRVAELTWDLGGLTYEMAVRDHYRLDVLARRAAELQEADAQLSEVQRLLASAEAGVHGQCRSCGAVHSRGAAFCWHCGAGLIEEARPAVLDGSGGSA
jgi:chorismate mutase